MTSKEYNIALIPDDNLSTKAISTSQNLSKLGSEFTLKIGTYYPHVSLMMLRIKENQLEKAIELLKEISEQTGSIRLTATDFRLIERYIDIEYEKNTSVVSLQYLVLDKFAEVRDGLREHDEIRMHGANTAEIDNLKKFGYARVGNLFRPHITFARFVDDVDPQTLLPDAKEFNGAAAKLGIFELGENGTCVKVICEYNLQG